MCSLKFCRFCSIFVTRKIQFCLKEQASFPVTLPNTVRYDVEDGYWEIQEATGRMNIPSLVGLPGLEIIIMCRLSSEIEPDAEGNSIDIARHSIGS